jgi:hypothetical protein
MRVHPPSRPSPFRARTDLTWLAALLASVAVAGYVLVSGFDQLAWERPIRPARVHQEPRTGPGA